MCIFIFLPPNWAEANKWAIASALRFRRVSWYFYTSALPPPHLLNYELSYGGGTPFQEREVLEMTRTDFPMGAAWGSSDTFPAFIVCVLGLLDMKLTGNRSNSWNCEVCKHWSQEVHSLLCSCWPPVMWQPSPSVWWHSSAQFPSRLPCSRLLCLSRNPGCQQCINAHSPEPEAETQRCNAFYSLLSEKCNLFTTTIHC